MVGEPAAAYGPKPAKAGSVASQAQLAPSLGVQIPPRQLPPPLGPVARNRPAVAATLKTWPPVAASTDAAVHDRPSTERQAMTTGAPPGPAPNARPTATTAPWPAATPIAPTIESAPAPLGGANTGSSATRDHASPSGDVQIAAWPPAMPTA